MITAGQLELCRRCINRNFNFDTGWSCKITGKSPEFENRCDNFKTDPIVLKEEEERKQHKEAMARHVKSGTRFLNYIIDYFAISAIIVIVLVLLSVLGYEYLAKSEGLMLFLNFSIAFLYYIIMEGLFAQTFGKMITKTIVVDKNNEMPSVGQVIGRTLCRFIPFEQFSFFGDEPGWHDSIPKTKVIKKYKPPKSDPEILDSF